MSLTPSSSVPATPDGGVLGLEDVAASDLVMPTLRIDHREGVYVNQLTDEKFAELDVILLGLVKQRVLWSAEIADAGLKERPLCRSYNFSEGHPQAEKFPWEASGFTEQEGTLPCASCKLKEWGTHPTRGAPWCSEQHTFGMLLEDNGEFSPILFSVQRSGIKESRTYVSAFHNAHTPMFTVRTKMTLESRKKGSNPYSVPHFSRGAATEESDYPNFANMYRSIREFLQTPWSGNDEDGAVVAESDDPVTTSPSAGSPLGAKPAAAPVVEDEDELPF